MMDEIIANPDFHGGLITNEDRVLLATQRFSGKLKVHQLKEALSVLSFGLLIPRHHFLFPQSNEVIAGLFEGGIMQRWITLAQNRIFSKVKSEPKVLTMSQLAIGFQIWLIFLVFATIIFVAEHLMNRCNI